MIYIGILSPHNKLSIGMHLKRLFQNMHKKYVYLNHPLSEDTVLSLPQSGIEYCVIDLEKNTHNYIDILILDTNNKPLISKIIKCLSIDTHLIYNADNGLPCIEHPFAVSYGLSLSATATISSVDEYQMVYCLQHPVVTLNGRYIGEGEFIIHTNDHDTENLLPAVTCGILCDIPDGETLTL